MMPKFEIKKIINQLIGGLSDRSRDVILSRFGIGKSDYETLEAIGQRYGITRERVRQIEADALKHIHSPAGENVYRPIVMALREFIKTKGGVMEEAALQTQFAANYFDTKPETTQKYERAAMLFLNLDKSFSRSKEDDNFWPRWAVDANSVKNQEGLASHLIASFKKTKKVTELAGLIDWAGKYSAGLSQETVMAYLSSAKVITKNAFGEWGLIDWPEITPRGVKDKAYLIMKRQRQPLHFKEVAEAINKSAFSNRVALPQTVHNELIKDSRFVLVGRGLYALKDWGYEAGTVKDVIKSVLTSGGPMHRDAVIKAVLAKRLVKPSTIILNLNSFKKGSDNKYTSV